MAQFSRLFSRLFGHIQPIDTATLRSAWILAQVSKKLGIA
jgi:hypothetical protein